MNYSVVFDIKDDEVNILGVFHQLENIKDKLLMVCFYRKINVS